MDRQKAIDESRFPFGKTFVDEVATAERRAISEETNYCQACAKDLRWRRIKMYGGDPFGQLLAEWSYAFCTGKDCKILWICD